ncbi:tyrosinase family protein [Zooshikella sp. RANM57]|uniref:tyrosinase family protein n=1 Tax=Zooshikella sp. RANM57 TaxID=3425863 RepID=UPI003D6E9541
MRIRQNVYDLKDDTLLWYSKAVEEMKKRDISDPSSWWYQAGIHGYPNRRNYGSEEDYQEALDFWRPAPGFPPSSALLESDYWDQCQHGTWYFLSWHRMYLHFFEQIVAKTIVDLGGPADWTLPFWNYCDYYDTELPESQREQALNIPPAFGNVEPNPKTPFLWIQGRVDNTLVSSNVDPWPAMNELEFTGNLISTDFGGGTTGFSHSGRRTGQLESLPHNRVHTDIGGAMGNPDTAGLDPIFWLHHANIDRLWQVWLDFGQGRENPQSAIWQNFEFRFHNAKGEEVTMKNSQVVNTQELGYTYQPNYPKPETDIDRLEVPKFPLSLVLNHNALLISE